MRTPFLYSTINDIPCSGIEKGYHKKLCYHGIGPFHRLWGIEQHNRRINIESLIEKLTEVKIHLQFERLEIKERT
jgi:hypothetical protein